MLEIHNLKKLYSSGKGLHSVSMSVSPGTITAVIGPNGAGKSTLFNVLNGILNRQSGSCTLENKDVSALPLAQTGFLPEAKFLIDNFTVIQMIDYIVCMKKLAVDEDKIDWLLNGFSLSHQKNVLISDLSQGMKKRVSIICAVIGFPKLIILDEPLNALDIQSVLFLKRILIELKKHGCYILISSHVLDFLDGLTDKVIFLKDGRIILDCLYDGTKIEKLYCELFDIMP